MRLVDSTLRHAMPVLGVTVRWLRDELRAKEVSVPLTDPFLRELAADAEASAETTVSGHGTQDLDAPHSYNQGSYIEQLRAELAARADFVRAWTQSDESDRAFPPALVRIARKYALPRAWRVSDPVAAPSRRPTPTYLYWASARPV